MSVTIGQVIIDSRDVIDRYDELCEELHDLKEAIDEVPEADSTDESEVAEERRLVIEDLTADLHLWHVENDDELEELLPRMEFLLSVSSEILLIGQCVICPVVRGPGLGRVTIIVAYPEDSENHGAHHKTLDSQNDNHFKSLHNPM